jgi:hypothetical protein
MSQLLSKAFTLFLFITSLTTFGFAQSKDRDNPTKLASNEISGFIEGTPNGDQISSYYSFMAGPGEVTITLDVESVRGFASAAYSVFDSDGRKVFGGHANSTSTGGERDTQRFAISRKVQLILRLELGSMMGRSDSGKFRIRFSGAIDSGGANIPTCLPKQGTLRVKMKDGSVKELDLKQAEEITIQP